MVDASDENRHVHLEEVRKVLALIHAEAVPRLLVYNKIDLNPDLKVLTDRDDLGKATRVFISAKSGAGLQELLSAIGELLGHQLICAELILLPEQAKIRASLYERSLVVSEKTDENGCAHLQVRMQKNELEKMQQALGNRRE